MATQRQRDNDNQAVTTSSHGTHTAGQNSKGESAAGGDSTGSGDKPSTGGNPDTEAPLTEPYGNFVSNHKPNLGGSPTPNSEESVCNTTPGASCQIFFVKGSTTKSLPVRTADSGGAAYWSWTLKEIGLEAGTWQVSAKATLGNQTKSGSDVIPLEVSP
jgi:hypothetical protein